MAQRALVLTLLTLLLGGCAAQRVVFQHAYRAPGRLSAEELERLQFFVSREVVLRREVDTSEHSVTAHHAYYSVDGRLVEEVRLPAGTPGLAMKVAEDQLWVSFEEDGVLPFEHLPEVEGAAQSGYRFPYRNGKRLKYAGHYYEVVSGGLGTGDDTYLVVKAKWQRRMENQRRTMRGRTLAGR